MIIGLLIIGGIITLFVIAIIVVKKIKFDREIREIEQRLAWIDPLGNNKSDRESDIFAQKDRIGNSVICSSPVVKN